MNLSPCSTSTSTALIEAERVVDLPTQDELQVKEAAALKKLQDFVAAQGAVLSDGWSVKIRVRLTQRRRGSFGRTSDNFYHSPCGSQVFRNYRQVAEFLGLPDSEAARGKRGPEARMQQPAAVATASHATTTSSQSAGTHLHGATGAKKRPHSACSSSSSGLNNSSSCISDDQAESQSPPPPAKKGRTKAMLVAKYAAAGSC